MNHFRFYLIIIFLTSFKGFSGGFIFPNVEYSYAQLYLFNLQTVSIQGRPDFSIYKEGVYAQTKIGNGYNLDDKTLERIHNVMLRGIDELVYGMSKCYFPRHGIIYFDKNGNPVASLSICFECERIGVWSINPLPKFKDNYEHFNYDKASNQLESMKKFIENAQIPVYDRQMDYTNYFDTLTSHYQLGEIEIRDSSIDKYAQPYSTDNVNSWMHEQSKHKFSSKTGILYYHQDSIQTSTLETKEESSVFHFSSNEGFLLSFYLSENGVTLPNGLSIGMSQDQVIASLGIYDGLSYPETIQIIGSKIKFTYTFQRRTLVRIDAVLL